MIAQAVALGDGRRLRHRPRHGRRSASTSTQLTAYALDALQTVARPAHHRPGRRPVDRGATISFALPGIHPHDVAQLLDEQGIAVRAGHHCARPVCVRYGIPATTRASFGVYTTTDEIDALVGGVEQVQEVFGR